MAKVTFNIQDRDLYQFRQERVPVMLTMMSGENLTGYLKSFNSYCLLIENDGDILIYKKTIASITKADETFRKTVVEAQLKGQAKPETKFIYSPEEQGFPQVQDPVCGAVFNWTHAAAVVRYHGQPHYFCSKSCRMKFIRAPIRYLEGD